MNLAWEVILRAMEQGIDPHTLQFRPALDGSPYLETSFIDVNLREVTDPVAELNPLYRFSNVFGPLLDRNEDRYPQLRELAFDVFFHYQSQLDLRQGLTKSEYYIRALLKDILSGTYGSESARVIRLFTSAETKRVLYGMLTLFRCGTSMELFRHVVRSIYPRSIVYRNNDSYREILLYLPQEKNDADAQKLDFLMHMFLDLNYTVYTFWKHHFGVIDLEKTLEFDEMLLF